MEPIVLSKEQEEKIKNYKEYVEKNRVKVSPNNLITGMFFIMSKIINDNQSENFKEYSRFVVKKEKQNEYEMKNYFYQSYVNSLACIVKLQKTNRPISVSILSYLLHPKIISFADMVNIFDCKIYDIVIDDNMRYYKF